MNSQLSERIRQKSGEFSKGQRAIARYIEEHSDKVAFMTASKLGATVGVGPRRAWTGRPSTRRQRPW